VSDSWRYVNSCSICDIETTIIVHDEEDIPAHCPMCGSDAELLKLRDSDEL